MWSSKDKLKEKTVHFLLLSASQKREYLSSLSSSLLNVGDNALTRGLLFVHIAELLQMPSYKGGTSITCKILEAS